MFVTTIERLISKANTSRTATFQHPSLTQKELEAGCKLGIDTYADTSCAGKHAHVIEFVEGKEIVACSWNNSKTANLRIANVAYAYDSSNGQVLILIVNQCIYGGAFMTDSLLQPIQCLQHGIQIDTRPKHFFPDSKTAQTIVLNNIAEPLHFNGPLPYLNVRRPTQDEFNHCLHIEITSHDDWDPYNASVNLSSIETNQLPFDTHPHNATFDDYNLCSISTTLMDFDHYDELSNHRELVLFDSDEVNDDYRSVHSIQSSAKSNLTPEELARLWGIGLKTACRTIQATTHRCVKTVGELTRRFRTDKAHMRYRRLSTKHGLFYVDTLKSKVKSIRGFTCGNLYTNSLGFRKFSHLNMRVKHLTLFNHSLRSSAFPLASMLIMPKFLLMVILRRNVKSTI
jgi:hypothetical protein